MRVSYEGGASAPRSDIRLIHLQYKVGKILGFNPISHRKDSLFSKLYVSIFLFSFWSLTASTITIKFKYFKRMHFLEDLLDLLEYLSELSFVTACLVSAGSKKWRRVFQSMNACERKFNRVNLLVENTTTLSILGIIFYHVALVALHVFENYLWIMNNQLALVYSFVPFRIALYYQFFSLIYISNFCRMLKRRYHCLRELTREVFTSGNARSKRYLVCRLRRVVSMYRSLYITVEQLNDIFGWQMFFYLECIVVSLVNSANFALNSLSRTNEYSLEERILYNCIYTSIYVVSLSHPPRS